MLVLIISTFHYFYLKKAANFQYVTSICLVFTSTEINTNQVPKNNKSKTSDDMIVLDRINDFPIFFDNAGATNKGV